MKKIIKGNKFSRMSTKQFEALIIEAAPYLKLMLEPVDVSPERIAKLKAKLQAIRPFNVNRRPKAGTKIKNIGVNI